MPSAAADACIHVLQDVAPPAQVANSCTLTLLRHKGVQLGLVLLIPALTTSPRLIRRSFSLFLLQWHDTW